MKIVAKSSLTEKKQIRFHYLQLYVGVKIVLQPNLRFLSFRQAGVGGPELKIVAVIVERHRRKNYWRISAMIVALRSPPLLF